MTGTINQNKRDDKAKMTRRDGLKLLSSTLTIMQLINFPKHLFDYRYIDDDTSDRDDIIEGFVSNHNGYEYNIRLFEIIPESNEPGKQYGRLIEYVCVCNNIVVHDLLFNMNGKLIDVNETPDTRHFTQRKLTSKDGLMPVNDYEIIKGDPLC